MLRYGIPEYRLPRDKIQKEVDEIVAAGVKIQTNSKVESLDKLFKDGYDAIVVAIGAHQGKRLPIPGNDLEGVMENIDFLKRVSLGKNVVVLGGGNVAFDCARVAKRLGAEKVQIACLETREGMTASDDEIQQGLEEGIIINNSRTFVRIVDDSGKAAGVECNMVESFSFDEQRRLNLVIKPDSSHILEAYTVIFAAGQAPEIPEEFQLETGRGGTIVVDDKSRMTSREEVYCTGDAVTGTASVIGGIAQGRMVAIEVHKYLGGDGNINEVLAPELEIEVKLVDGKMMMVEPSALIHYLEDGRALASFDENDSKVLYFFEKPTIVCSGETLANVVAIVKEQSESTRLYHLTIDGIEDKFIRGGVDATVKSILEKANIDLGNMKIVLVGGLRGKLISGANLEEVIGATQAAGIRVLINNNCIVDFVMNTMEVLKKETCGTCALCRQGLLQLFHMLRDITAKKGRANDVKDMLEIASGVKYTANCDFGKTATDIIISSVAQFEDEFEKHIDRGRCDALVCKKMIIYHILGEKCQGCGDCTNKCPQGAIDGGENLIHVIDQEKCDQCGECITVCDTLHQAITKAGGVKPKTPTAPIPVGTFKKQGLGLRGKKRI